MTRSIFEGKQILAAGDDPDILEVLEEEILEACPNCRFDKATNYIQAVEMMISLTYDVVVLDIMGVRGFDLLDLAVMRNFPAVMLGSNPLNPHALKRSIELRARAYFPKDRLREIVPFLEDVLTHKGIPGWKRLLEKMKGFFGPALGPDSEIRIGSYWQEWPKVRLQQHEER